MTTGQDMTPDEKERERRRMVIWMTLIAVGVILIILKVFL